MVRELLLVAALVLCFVVIFDWPRVRPSPDELLGVATVCVVAALWPVGRPRR